MSKNEGDRLDVNTAGRVVEREHPFGVPFRDNLQVIAANPEAYDSAEQLLDDIYTKYLQSRYAIYTYGRDWVLARPSTYVTLFALPLEWLRHKRQRLMVDTIPDYLDRTTPLYTFGLGSGIWALIDSDFDFAFGLCTSDEQVASKVFKDHPKALCFTFDRWAERIANEMQTSDEMPIGFYRLDQVISQNYKYKVLIQLSFYTRRIFPEPTKNDVLVIREMPTL
jgi:hypothetical protein